ncbi:uncharacterized protein EI90DRAFT_3076857 [Cantharellus anzutake]|uniref:uncharacterized protein n=1 Tax=Cantharellus anzutake TaxID=1750568 RepID=UPI00190710A1|nr:uncharacterized protein EI90DRAFT_3076857 [Cantharellus anzutake]KAF8323503.1 hypothetical protein EI90DRAFT_3076857 [Cantharellus anzutake]
MTAGGHFAGMVARVSNPGPPDEDADDVPRPSNRKRPNKKGHHQKQEYEIVAHKTFHRYTTRRKQGGSQSINDNAKGHAKSAGAMLRRYGEQSLRDDIRALLQDWADNIDLCDRIFIRASVSNRRIFLEGENSPIQKGDDRLRTFPFPTRRPTLSELSRCLLELTRVKITHLTDDELRQADEEYLASIRARQKLKVFPSTEQESAQKQKPNREVLSPEELAARIKWRRLLDMVRKGRVGPLQKFWNILTTTDGAGVLDAGDSAANTRIPTWLRKEEGKRCGATLLQAATAWDQEEVVRWLLLELRADPTIGVPSALVREEDAKTNSASDDETSNYAHRKAYNVARSQNVRNVFRRAAHAHPEWWDWLGKGSHGAGVTSVLDPEKEAVENREADRKRGLKERMMERERAAAAKAAEEQERLEREEAERVKKEAEAAAAAKAANRKGPQRLGGPAGGGIIENVSSASMSPEMRARIERERRARAAEARLRAANPS